MARTLAVIVLIAGFCIHSVAAETPSGEAWPFKKIMVPRLAEGVPGILKTQDAVSPNLTPGMVLASLVAFTLVYGLLMAADVYLIVKYAKAGPPQIIEERKVKVTTADEAYLE